MKLINYSFALFLIIVVEGYIVLSSELLAIRQTVPHVGSGTDTISIIIAAVLLPLAFGYHFGGQFKPGYIIGNRFFLTTRKKLILNLWIAGLFLLFGLSHEFIFRFFAWLQNMEIDNRLVQISLYSGLFLVLPVYLLGQTVPLISRFFSKQELSRITGKMLFLSTTGSFCGAVFSTLVLMATLGVHHTASLNFVLITSLIILLSKRIYSKAVLTSTLVALVALLVNADYRMERFSIRANNQYNTIITHEAKNGARLLYLNNNASSLYTDEGRKHSYIEFAEKLTIKPISGSVPPKHILVIGAGGFTFGDHDKNNLYTFVDIDKDLLAISEQYLLKKPLAPNKTFVAQPARAFLSSTKQKYDVIYLDAYLGGVSIPEHLITIEFFESVKSKLKDEGVLMSNMILSPNFKNSFSRNIDNTFRAVFPHISRHVIGEFYALWSDSDTRATNVAYIYKHDEDLDLGGVYTDNKNTVFYDKPKKMKP